MSELLLERQQGLKTLCDTGRIDWSRPFEEALSRAGLGGGYTTAEWAELAWYGPLEPHLRNEGVTDLLVNGPGRELMVVDRGLRISTGVVPHPTWVAFVQRQLLLRSGLIDVARPDEWRSPLMLGTADRRLRFAITRPPATPDGPSLAVRLLPRRWRSLDDLVQMQVLTREVAELMLAALRGGVSVMLAGGTGSGKTTLAAALLLALGDEKRVVIIEECSELPMLPDSVHHEVLRSGTTFSECVRFALRQRPDLLVLGEVRGPEALAQLQAAATGHPGVATIHAPDPQTALKNLERMACEAGEVPPSIVRGLLTSAAVPLLIAHVGRYGGRLRLGRLEEVLETNAGQTGERYPTNLLAEYDEQRDVLVRRYPVQRPWGRGQW